MGWVKGKKSALSTLWGKKRNAEARIGKKKGESPHLLLGKGKRWARGEEEREKIFPPVGGGKGRGFYKPGIRGKKNGHLFFYSLRGGGKEKEATRKKGRRGKKRKLVHFHSPAASKRKGRRGRRGKEGLEKERGRRKGSNLYLTYIHSFFGGERRRKERRKRD